MSENMQLWRRVCVTDPKAVKPITGKQYNGNSPKPYWIVERLTAEFGPCGIGWGFTILSERMERLTPTDVLHVAVVRLWFKLNGERGEFEQIGQTKAVYAKKDGSLLVDEDAPKKSVTDALVKCASYLGFAGDIFSGRWDDSKYVAEANREWREREAADAPKPQSGSPSALVAASIESSLSDGRKSELEELALTMANHFANGDGQTPVTDWQSLTDNDDKAYLWHLLRAESKLRSHIKATLKAA